MPQQLFERPVVVTNCTTRKRVLGRPIALDSRSARGSVNSICNAWVAKLRSAERLGPVGELYLGRAFVDARAVARRLEAEFFVVSAGLGLVHERELAPTYDVSVGGRAGGRLQAALRSAGAGSSHWWSELTGALGVREPLHHLMLRNPSAMVFLALPATYLAMVAEDLTFALADREVTRRLRIFTSEAGRASVPTGLQASVMPYGERLESVPGYAGTQVDFPQRAMRHFVEQLGADGLPLEDAHEAVASSLRPLRVPKPPVRARKTDAQIKGMLRRQWQRYGGSSSKLLRYLRDEAQVACEQSRFRDLWREVRTQFDRRES